MIKLILSLSLSGSIVAGLIFAVKPLFNNRVSKTFQYYIWVVVLLRLFLPISPELSLMNNVFYPTETDSDISASAMITPSDAQGNISSSLSLPVQKKVEAGEYNGDSDHSRYLRDLFAQTALIVWLLGVLITLSFQFINYVHFISRLKRSNIAVTAEEQELFHKLRMKNSRVRLFRNRFASTPMLVGILSPCIIVPDVKFTPKQLENILRHELAHLRRFDTGLKWFTVLVTALHWFNPIMIFIKREINRACELACDEAVIKGLSTSDKQAYGETLISVVAERKYPIGVLSTTMCEEKKTLKERLAAIMKYSKKSKWMVVLAIVVFAGVIGIAVTLGAGVGRGASAAVKAPVKSEEYNLTDISKNKTPYIGNNSKVSALAASLPLPDAFFRQQYISLKTKGKPYGLTVYYEVAGEGKYEGEWLAAIPGSNLQRTLYKNALVLFCMIGNMDYVTFAFRNSMSNGKLDESAYGLSYTFQRKEIEDNYGDLSLPAGDLNLLAKALDEAASHNKEIFDKTAIDSTAATSARIDELLAEIMSSPMVSSNTGDYIREHRGEYDEIVAMGRSALPYLSIILESGDRGLRGNIVMFLCKDIADTLK